MSNSALVRQFLTLEW